MGVSTQDRTDFLNMLDACRTEQQLFSRLTFAVMFHQTDPDACLLYTSPSPRD